MAKFSTREEFDVAPTSNPDLSIFDLSGKKALVTGGASGIGRACAIGLAKAGADVAIVDLQTDMGMETVSQIEALGRDSMFVRCDVSDAKAVDAMVAEIVGVFGRLDIAFNNAGVIGNADPSTADSMLALWDKVMATNLTGVFYCCRAEAKYMIPQKYGKIINTASISGSIINNLGPGFVMSAAYCVSKAGVKILTKALAVEWAEHNISVNCISPGYTITPQTEAVQIPELLATELATTPMHRRAEAEELVGGVVYLASDASSYTTGTDLTMDGGHTIW